MKKFILFIFCLLSVLAPAKTVTILHSELSGGAVGMGSSVELTKEGVTLFTDLGYVASESLRIYTGGTLLISANRTIESVSFSYATTTKDTFPETVPTDTMWTAQAPKQVRITEVVVVLSDIGEEGGGEGDEPIGGEETGGRKRTYNLYGITEEDILISGSGEVATATYTEVSYVGMGDTMGVSFHSMPDLHFWYANSATKASFFSFRDTYMRANGKRTYISIDNVAGGDTIEYVLSAKGTTLPIMSVSFADSCNLIPIDGLEEEHQVTASSGTSVSDDYAAWEHLQYVVKQDCTHCCLMETAGGYRIARISVLPYQEPTIPDTLIEPVVPDMDTVYCYNAAGWSNMHCYTWTSAGTSSVSNGDWPGVAMEATGYDGVWMYSCEHGQYANCIFNNGGNGVRTADLTFERGMCYNNSTDRWVTLESIIGGGSTEYPTNEVLSQYYEEGQLCVCIKFEGEVCNDIVFTGTYNQWATSKEECVLFQPVEGYEGWWVVAVDDDSAVIEGKPVQLRKDGSFSWENQAGDVASWTLLSGSVNIIQGVDTESDLVNYSKATPVVLVSAYWKEHRNLCEMDTMITYHVSLYAPACEEHPEYAPAVSGTFNVWTKTPMVYNSSLGCYELDFQSALGDKMRFREVNDTTWSNQIAMYNGSVWQVMDTNIVLTDVDTLVFDYSEGRWTECTYMPEGENVMVVDTCTTMFFDGNWEQEYNSYAVWSNDTLRVSIAEDKQSRWQAQAWLHSNLQYLKDYTEVSIRVRMRANKDVENITIKAFDQGILYEVNDNALTANEERTFILTGQYTYGTNGILVFDFGYATAGTEIQVYDIKVVGELKYITCAEASSQTLSLAENTSGASVTVMGYITETDGVVSRGQQTFYMDDVQGSGEKTFLGYWAYLPSDMSLNVGDKIMLSGDLFHYYSSAKNEHSPEIKNGSVEVLQAAAVHIDTIEVSPCEAITLCNRADSNEVLPEWYSLRGVVSEVISSGGWYPEQTFTIRCDEEVLTVYQGSMTGDYVEVGDSVWAIGKLKNYGGVPELVGAKIWIQEYPIAEEDWLLLQELYAEVRAGGAGENVLNWDFSVGREGGLQFEHVTCKQGRVVGLDLSVIGLSGEVPKALRFKKLQTLNISSNNFEGNITPIVDSLPSLTTLYAHCNRFMELSPVLPRKLGYINIGGQQLDTVYQVDISSVSAQELLQMLPTIVRYDGSNNSYSDDISLNLYSEKIHPYGSTQMDISADNIQQTWWGTAFYGKSGDTLRVEESGGTTFRMAWTFDMGDVNFGNGVDATDLQALVLFIFEEYYSFFNATAADVYADEVINVQDVIGIVNLLLTDSTASASPKPARVKTETIHDAPNAAVLYVRNEQVVLRSPTPVGALCIKAAGVDWDIDAQGLTQMVSNGNVVAYSMSGATLPANEDIVLGSMLNKTAWVQAASLSDPEAQPISVQVVSEITTAADEVQTMGDSTLYDVLGRKQNGLQQGINIVVSNGAVRKVIVK